LRTQIPGREPSRGKVRDIYDLGDKLLIAATDRISAFDVIMTNGIPSKGVVLTQISKFWFEYFKGFVEHHLISDDVADFPAPFCDQADQLAGRSMLVKKVEVLPIECVVRGYLAGSGWKEYQADQTVCGVKLPAGDSRWAWVYLNGLSAGIVEDVEKVEITGVPVDPDKIDERGAVEIRITTTHPSARFSATKGFQKTVLGFNVRCNAGL